MTHSGNGSAGPTSAPDGGPTRDGRLPGLGRHVGAVQRSAGGRGPGSSPAGEPDVTSYRYTIDGQVRIRHDSRSASVAITGHGLVDVERQRANVTVQTRRDTAVGHRETRVAYLDGYTLDVSCARVGWASHNLTESTRWLNYTSLGRQLALLDRTTVYWSGTAVVDGVETAVVTAHPTERQLQTGPRLPTGNAGPRGGATFQNATVRAWIDTGTGRVLRVQREIRVRGDGSTGVATITYRFSGYNDPTTVTRPSFEDYGPQWRSDCVKA